MSEPTGMELNEKIADIREWLVRIDTKVDFLNEVKHTAETAEAKAEAADAKASRALSMAQENEKDIAEIKANDKWKWSAIISILAMVVSIGIAYFK